MDCGKVHRLVEITLAGGAVAEVGDGDHIFPSVLRGEGSADTVEDLRGDAARATYDVQIFAAVVARELTPAAVGVGGLAEGMKHHILRLRTHGKGHGQVTVVGDENVDAGPHAVHASDLRRLVAFAGDEEVDLSLSPEQPEPLRHGARREHVAVDSDEVGGG